MRIVKKVGLAKVYVCTRSSKARAFNVRCDKYGYDAGFFTYHEALRVAAKLSRGRMICRKGA